jgi:hypothetical protein
MVPNLNLGPLEVRVLWELVLTAKHAIRVKQTLEYRAQPLRTASVRLPRRLYFDKI